MLLITIEVYLYNIYYKMYNTQKIMTENKNKAKKLIILKY